MLRLTHTQSTSGRILINDIDDGLPNKTAHRLTGDPDKYHRDGNSLGGADKSTEPDVNYPKQKCYIPFSKPGDATLPGFIDLKETDRVLLSQAKGVIKGFVTGGKITVTSFLPSDVVAPAVTTAKIAVPSAGDLTLTGTNLTSLAPNLTKVYLTGAGAVSLTQAQILAAVGGVVTATSIVIPAALIPGIAATTTTVQVLADDQLSTPFQVTT